MEVNTSHVYVAEVGSSTGMEWEKMASEHRIYSYLSHCIVSPMGKRSCIFDSISASSTDNYPDESIENTLEPRDRVGNRPSYWSSEGQSNPAVPETLTYSLCSKLCVINEINIQPFKAYFQDGHPIYSAQAVRFRVGYSRSIQETEKISQNEGKVVEHATCLPDVNYVWTYVSPIFPMVQENVLQSFKLPRPILGIGGVLQVELLGRVQRQEMDDLYYFCMCYVRVIGRPLSPILDVDLSDSSGKPVLKFLPAAMQSALLEQQSTDPTGPSSEQSPTTRNNPSPAVGGWILNALLGTGLVADESDDSSDEENWYI